MFGVYQAHVLLEDLREGARKYELQPSVVPDVRLAEVFEERRLLAESVFVYEESLGLELADFDVDDIFLR